MDKKNNAYYLGIDLCDTYAMVSFYQLNMEEPDTVSTIAGSENYRIPLILAHHAGKMWECGIMVMKPERWQKRVRFSV